MKFSHLTRNVFGLSVLSGSEGIEVNLHQTTRRQLPYSTGLFEFLYSFEQYIEIVF